jgi:hypothetical protein
VFPANDEIAACGVVFVSDKLAALELEVDSDALKRTILASQLCSAIGKTTLNTFHDKSKVAG